MNGKNKKPKRTKRFGIRPDLWLPRTIPVKYCASDNKYPISIIRFNTLNAQENQNYNTNTKISNKNLGIFQMQSKTMKCMLFIIVLLMDNIKNKNIFMPHAPIDNKQLSLVSKTEKSL
ncbi:hypothetical protein ACJX0J_016252, partial [Zea mays]